MGNEGETNTRKPRYNISMSRRTRKQPQNDLKESPDDHDEHNDIKQIIIISRSEDKQKSLKQLIEGSRCSLAQHFRDEEDQKQQISAHVIVDHDHQDGFDQRLRLKRSTVKNYVKVFVSHLIKVKHESYIRSWKKRAHSLKLIVHK